MPRQQPSSRSSGNAVRHASGVLVCPRCEIALRGSDHELGIAWRCGRCQGQSLNFSQFRRLIPRHGADDIWQKVTANPLAPRRQTLCPECLARMDAVQIPLRGRPVELDICRPCQRLWLDRQEEPVVASAGLAQAPASQVDRRRGWFGNRVTASEVKAKSQREALFGVLERNADRLDQKLERRRGSRAAFFGIVAGAVCYAVCRDMPGWLGFRLAALAGLSVYTILMLCK